MRRSVTIFFLLLCSTLLLGQGIKQEGIAYLYDYKTKTKSPIANVSLKVNYAEPTTSHDDGTFVLAFGGQVRMGDKISQSSQPYYKGMKVFNKDEVDRWYVVNGRLRLIMCDYEEFELVKKEWYEKGVASVERRRREEIASLQKESEEYYHRLSEIQEKYDRIMDDMRRNADAMARIDQSELDASMNEVIDLYQSGSVDEAMRKLEEMHLAERFIESIDRAEYHRQELKAAEQDSLKRLSDLRLSVDLYKQNGNYAKAGENLKLIADKLHTFDDVLAYAKFCIEQNDYYEAIKYYEKAKGILMDAGPENVAGYEHYMAVTLNDLAMVYKDIQHFTESEELFKESLAISKKLVSYNPAAYGPNMAVTLNNFAILYGATARFTESEALIGEALEIYRSLDGDDLIECAPSVARTLETLAQQYLECNRFSESEERFDGALAIWELLYEVDPATYEPDLARVRQYQARLYLKQNRHDESESLLVESVESFRRLAKVNPAGYESCLSGVLLDLAECYYLRQRYPECEAAYIEALDIDRRLAQINPAAYEPNLAVTLACLGGFYFSISQRASDGEPLLLEAIDIFRRLAGYYPSVYEPNLPPVMNNLANVYRTTKRYPESEKMYIDAIEITRKLAAAYPEMYTPSLAQELTNLANLYFIAQRYSDSEPPYREALDLRRELSAIDPAVYEPDYATSLCNLAVLYYKKRQYAECEGLFEEALEIFRRLPVMSYVYARTAADAMVLLADIYERSGRWEEGVLLRRELQVFVQGQYENNPESWRNIYASVLVIRTTDEIHLGRYTAAEELVSIGKVIDPSDPWTVVLEATALLFQGEYSKAEAIYLKYKDEQKDYFLHVIQQYAKVNAIPKERKADVEKIKALLSR